MREKSTDIVLIIVQIIVGMGLVYSFIGLLGIALQPRDSEYDDICNLSEDSEALVIGEITKIVKDSGTTQFTFQKGYEDEEVLSLKASQLTLQNKKGCTTTLEIPTQQLEDAQEALKVGVKIKVEGKATMGMLTDIDRISSVYNPSEEARHIRLKITQVKIRKIKDNDYVTVINNKYTLKLNKEQRDTFTRDYYGIFQIVIAPDGDNYKLISSERL